MLIDTKCWLSEFLVHSIEAIRSLARRASESILRESCARPRRRRSSSERNKASGRSGRSNAPGILTASTKTLLIVGTLLVSLFGGMLAMYSPMPARLSTTHGKIRGMHAAENCSTCHHPDGMAEGCLSCHSEIREQLTNRSGYHHSLLEGQEPRCTPCHTEHFGPGFALISERSWGAQVHRAFRHPHVERFLSGAHDVLDCEECHVKHLQEPLTLPAFPATARGRTFLGLTKKCLACHEDPHAGGLSYACDSCHGQHSFVPTVLFDHGELFPLTGPHADQVCRACHIIPEAPKQDPLELLIESGTIDATRLASSPALESPPSSAAADHPPPPFPFDKTRGQTCEQCHVGPHHLFEDNCDSCHAGHEPDWLAALSAVTQVQHIRTGFRLSGPHEALECAACHPRDVPFDQRYHDPGAPGYLRTNTTCQGCHADVHEGQFEGRYDRCLDCHEEHRFVPTRFGYDLHARRYPLSGAHAAIACSSCHETPRGGTARRFAGTTHLCRECHQSPHGHQFVTRIEETDCVACHRRDAETFAIRPFDHAVRTGFELTGAHANSGCKRCHVERNVDDGGLIHAVRIYEDTPRRCASCHVDPHNGQFEVHNDNDCTYCHASDTTWAEVAFDHDIQSRFPLLGAHAEAACSRCHVEVTTPEGHTKIHYRPMGRECRDCHEIPDAIQSGR